MRRRAPLLLLSSAVVLLVGCGGDDGPTDPSDGSVRVVAGADVADTVDARPTQALAVEVRDARGRPMRDAVVRFESRPPTGSGQEFASAVRVCSVSDADCGRWSWPLPPGAGVVVVDTTDADGRAFATVQLGTAAGAAYVDVVVPASGATTAASFTVRPGAAHTVRLSAEEYALTVGETVTASATVADRHGNARPERPTFAVSGPSGAAVNATTGVVTATELGTYTLTAAVGAATATASVSAIPPGRLLVWAPDHSSVRLIDTDGTDRREVTGGTASGHGVFPRFAPGRARIALHAAVAGDDATPRRLLVVDTTGANRLEVVPAGVGRVHTAQPLADGTTLFLAGDDEAMHVWRAAADGRVTKVALVPDYRDAYGGADISPDGARLAYSARASDGWSSAGLHVLDLATGQVRRVAADGFGPRWSPGSDRLLYLVSHGQWFDEETGIPTVANADGADPRPIGDHELAVGVSWSPDGAHVVARDGLPGALRIVRVADGRSVRMRFRYAPGEQAPSESDGYVHYHQPDWR